MDKVYVLVTIQNQFLGVFRTREQAEEAKRYEYGGVMIMEEELED